MYLPAIALICQPSDLSCLSKKLYRPNDQYENAEYVTLVQTIPIFFSEGDYILTPEDLPSSSPLLIYSAAVIADSYIPNNQAGRESFMMVRLLCNGVTNNKNVESKVIVSYKNENNRYNAMKNNLKKTVLSVVGRLKISSKKFSHILASDIEWSYVSNEPSASSTTINAKEISEVEFNEDLDGIKEKYATLTSQVPQKRQNTKHNINLRNSNNKRSNNKTSSLNFVNVISQVQKGSSSVKSAYKGQSSSTNNFASTSQNTNDQTNPMIQIVLASCYHYGKWVQKDEHKAFNYYQKSAKTNDSCEVFSFVSVIKMESELKRMNIRHSFMIKNLQRWVTLVECQVLQIGKSSAHSVQKDEHKAFNYYQKSAKTNDSCGVFLIGVCYKNGIRVEKDEHKAFIYYQKSVEMGYASGMSSVADW
ncbi:hypothetical protein C2G38_2192012 [Gigaspora rosea]|uniref:HCP-like protein n=1 Tax=Gigaspora rosea TaxID=44941 RepID=A0A397V152_9GLOM|nr:hypothetical protein C2G38_2192012 [Gigaspora rosea]